MFVDGMITLLRPAGNLSPRFARRMSGGLIARPVGIDNTFHQKYVRVSILGGDTATGEATAYLLKQNPIVSQLYLYGNTDVVGIAADLRHMDTRCEIKGYTGKEGLHKAVRRADIVLIIGLDKCPQNASVEFRFRSEAGRIVELTEACSRYCPKSLITVCASPVAATLPLVAAVFRRTHWYHPGRIIGSVALAQVRANTLTARYQDLDPVSVNVPLVGGPDADCVVPLFSRATPVSVPPNDCEILQDRIGNVSELVPMETPKPCKIDSAPSSEAYAINQLVTTMGLGLCGDDKAVFTAFIRQNILANCRHLVTTVKFGPGGVVHNYGVPKLTKLELKYLEKATLLLEKREQLALDFLAQLEAHQPTRAKTVQVEHFTPIVHQTPSPCRD